MKFFFKHCQQSTLLLIFTGLFISVFQQNTFAQQTQPASKEVAGIKPALNLDNIFKALRSDKAPLVQKNQILIQGVRERGVAFILTSEVEEELKEQGASKILIEAIRKETSKTQESSFFYRERADDFRYKRNYTEAIENYNKTLELDPNDKVAYNNRGRAYEGLQKYDDAIADFSKVIELDPTDRNGYHNRGVIYYHRNDFEKSIADYTKSIEIDPRFAEAYVHRANAYQILGKRDLAEADRQKARELGRK